MEFDFSDIYLYLVEINHARIYPLIFSFFDFKSHNQRSMNRKFREIEPHIVSEIIHCIGDISYGEVVVTIHDARIVQVEKREKRRFDCSSNGSGRLRPKHKEAAFRRPDE